MADEAPKDTPVNDRWLAVQDVVSYMKGSDDSILDPLMHAINALPEEKRSKVYKPETIESDGWPAPEQVKTSFVLQMIEDGLITPHNPKNRFSAPTPTPSANSVMNEILQEHQQRRGIDKILPPRPSNGRDR